MDSYRETEGSVVLADLCRGDLNHVDATCGARSSADPDGPFVGVDRPDSADRGLARVLLDDPARESIVKLPLRRSRELPLSSESQPAQGHASLPISSTRVHDTLSEEESARSTSARGAGPNRVLFHAFSRT